MLTSRPLQLTNHTHVHVINKKVTSFPCQTSIDKRDAQMSKQVPENTLILSAFCDAARTLLDPNARVNCVFGGIPLHLLFLFVPRSPTLRRADLTSTAKLDEPRSRFKRHSRIDTTAANVQYERHASV